MTEAQLSRKIIKRLKDHDCFAVKNHGGPHSVRGLPDIVGCYAGSFFALEVKLPGREKTLTELQAKKLRDIREAGGVAEMVTSVKQALEAVDCG